MDLIYCLWKAATLSQSTKGNLNCFLTCMFFSMVTLVNADSKILLLKVGHAGTLDPMATGLLIVCVGKATKLAERYTKSNPVHKI